MLLSNSFYLFYLTNKDLLNFIPIFEKKYTLFESLFSEITKHIFIGSINKNDVISLNAFTYKSFNELPSK